MKKAGSVVLCAFLVSLLSVPTPVYAWKPDEFFGVSVDEANIPTETAYIDLLLPISPEDEAYAAPHVPGDAFTEGDHGEQGREYGLEEEYPQNRE